MTRKYVLPSLLLLTACYHNPQSLATTDLHAIHLNQAPQTPTERALPLSYWTERRDGKDTLSISVLRVDLQDAKLQVSTVIADDPDGSGPAEAALTDPLSLAQTARVLAAVNANAFAGMPDSTGKRDSNWHETQPVDIAGVAVHAGIARSRYDNTTVADAAFGITTDGKPYIGKSSTAPQFLEAVNGWSFSSLVDGGVAVPAAGGPRHPRTAIGFDRTGRWLYLVVVDGRQPGYSNGVTGRELADVMIQIGCDRAVNVDGGGSSILLVQQTDGSLATVNRPSGGSRRPVPVMLSVQPRR